MKANSKKNSRIVTVALAIAAVGLLSLGTVGGARAAITNYSGEYTAEFATQTIDVKLTENGNVVSGDLLQDATQLTLGKDYEEALGANNPEGNIEEYVRLTVHKYWLDGDNKQPEDVKVDPSMITLLDGSSDWIKGEESENGETVTYYYTKPLAPGKSTSNAVAGFIVDSSDIETQVTQSTSTDGKTITTTYDYNGLSVGLSADVDGVQTHNPEAAMLSAWGVTVTLDGNGNITSVTE